MAESLTPFEALEKAIRIAGSESALARMVGCTPGNIWQLRRRKAGLSHRYVLKAEAGTGISRYVLDPGTFGREPTAPPANISAPIRATDGELIR